MLETRKSTIDEIKNATTFLAENKLNDNYNSIKFGKISHHLIIIDSIDQIPQDAPSEIRIFKMSHTKTEKQKHLMLKMDARVMLTRFCLCWSKNKKDLCKNG